jgi:hypothetical protein
MNAPARARPPVASLLALAAVLGAAVVGATLGLGTALLVLAGGALLGAVFLFWSSLERLTGESPLTLGEAIGLGAPTAEEERKRAVVRGLKDLEYERSVGKVSEADYADLSQRYRAEAKALLRSLDADLAPARKAAEERLAARLAAAGLPSSRRDSPSAAEPGARTQDASKEEGTPVRTAPPTDGRACPECAAVNDEDALYCKRCGSGLGKA